MRVFSPPPRKHGLLTPVYKDWAVCISFAMKSLTRCRQRDIHQSKLRTSSQDISGHTNCY